MKVEINGREVRIKGDAVGKRRHVMVDVCTKNGKDIYSIYIIKDGFAQGFFKTLRMDDDFVIYGKRLLSHE